MSSSQLRNSSSGGVSPAAAAAAAAAAGPDLAQSADSTATDESGSADSDSESFVLGAATPEDAESEAGTAAMVGSRSLQEHEESGAAAAAAAAAADADADDYEGHDDGEDAGGEDIKAGDLNQDLMTHCRRVFHEFESGTGFLLTRDLGAALRALGQVPSEHQVEQLTSRLEQLELYDRGSTKLTFQEFYKAAHEYNATKSDIKKSVMDAFSVLDKDNSGAIEVNKLLSVLASVGEVLTPADIKELLKELPVDKDGKVDYAKFVEEALGCDIRGATGKSAGGRAKSK